MAEPDAQCVYCINAGATYQNFVHNTDKVIHTQKHIDQSFWLRGLVKRIKNNRSGCEQSSAKNPNLVQIQE